MSDRIDRILVVMAHPDDPEIACGGTVARWCSEGKQVRYLLLTSGDKGTKDPELSPHRLAETREEEQRKAAQILGVATLSFLRHKDGELENNLSLRGEIAFIIREFKPEIVVSHDPWRPYQLQPDHRASGFATCDAVVAARDHLFLPALSDLNLGPHTPSEIYFALPEEPDLIVDITDFMEKKLQALAEHRTQTNRVPEWRQRTEDLAIRAAKDQGFKYGEPFKRLILTRPRL